MNNADRIKVALTGGYTRRWHVADIVGEERVDSHTWGMLAMIHILHPAPSVDLLKAVTFHDSPGEPFSGDIPYGAKRAFPELRAADQDIGERANRLIDVSVTLTPQDKWWLSLVDMGQAYLFAKRQVAQGNGLMRGITLNCASELERMARRVLEEGSGAPDDAWQIVNDILTCSMSTPMNRDLVTLEENNAC